MSHLTLRAACAAVLAFSLAACTSEQPTGATSSAAGLDLQATAGTSLVINEIMPNPAGVSDDVGEWFEIHNAGTAAVDLQDYVIASNNDAAHVINTSVVVPAGGYVVLARNGDPAVNGGVTAHYSYAHQTFNLNNSATDWLALRDPSGASVDSVAWGTASPPNGASRGLIDPALDNLVMSGSSWSTQTTVYGLGDRGTPGAANDGASPPPPPPPPPGTGAVVINEILQDP
ncbi:MAG TPA: lamin tail domain-containing protein, partial [Longimicrobium sp.]